MRTLRMILNFADQILADTIGCAVSISKPVGPQYRVCSPGSRAAVEATKVDGKTLGREPPIGVEDLGRLG